ncbi:hypothetical protein DID96_17815 [Burkholderia sp. Bp8963]|uniref:hypothetical protein n=1 Tax=Burkholderia sp. Bp8963 TaxID=2184547 RepID=UPI000F59397D|nr:hypothetical protein [Burkholderia sp. Bp8963]RQS69227.1 hypothetical protein DID96_17815 [Burkholderia sp. Bp8963]
MVTHVAPDAAGTVEPLIDTAFELPCAVYVLFDAVIRTGERGMLRSSSMANLQYVAGGHTIAPISKVCSGASVINPRSVTPAVKRFAAAALDAALAALADAASAFVDAVSAADVAVDELSAAAVWLAAACDAACSALAASCDAPDAAASNAAAVASEVPRLKI